MNKRFQYVMLFISALGYILLSLSMIFRKSLTDFILGLLEGSAIVFIVAWFIYMCWCITKKKNPYKIEKINK